MRLPRWGRKALNSPWGRSLQRVIGRPPAVPDPLWSRVLGRHGFLQTLATGEQARLKTLCEHFLAQKEFTGVHGLSIHDEIALTIAAQACLPWIHWGLRGLDWYQGFVGIVVYPDEAVATREVTDATGVVHRYREILAGETLHGGPVMLAWSHVVSANQQATQGHNVVIHEFAHQIDMRYKSQHETPNGCPRLPTGFLGLSAAQGASRWQHDWSAAYQRFVSQVDKAERFGTTPPWMDPYGAQSPAEFFAVACEAFWVNRPAFSTEFPELTPLLDAFFKRPRETDSTA